MMEVRYNYHDMDGSDRLPGGGRRAHRAIDGGEMQIHGPGCK